MRRKHRTHLAPEGEELPAASERPLNDDVDDIVGDSDCLDRKDGQMKEERRAQQPI